MTTEFLIKEVQRLIAEGQQVTSTKFDAGMGGVKYMGSRPTGVELYAFSRWQAGCKNLLRLLGEYADPWKKTFDGNNAAANATRMLATLEAIEHAISSGLLVSVEDMVRAESFNGLLDQADFLHQQNFFVAGGVLGRAVLEEHLRSWVANAAIAISKVKPTLNDFKDALYKDKKFTVSVLKHIEAMAAVGNDAAHNKPELTSADVTRMLRDVREFIAKHP
jgi:hypothetical protein